MDALFSLHSFVALLTLILLEVVLGIDNLIFIAILSEKVPPKLRDKVRVLGLGLALCMRLLLLSLLSWVVSLNNIIFHIGSQGFSWRHIILFTGGMFLLFKGTRELHERLESAPHQIGGNKAYASFWLIVFQIVILDAVFSLDAIVTAIGVTKHLPIMMLAVSVAMAIMLLAAKPLTKFVNAHPTIVVLCLSFLLLIGLSLIAEGLGFDLPKGYLYAAIGFSVTIEFFNQVAQYNEQKMERRKPMRLRTAEAVLRLLGSDALTFTAAATTAVNDEYDKEEADTQEEALFASEEVNMVTRVLTLSERTVRSIMTHRADALFIDIDKPADELKEMLLEGTPSVLPVCKGRLDNVIGVAHASDLLADLLLHGKIQTETLSEPAIIPETMRVTKVLGALRNSSSHLLLVTDEYGSIEGLVTSMDVFEAITGELQEEGEKPAIETISDNSWEVAGTADVHYLAHFFELPELVSESNDYTSLAGFMLDQLGKLPEAGDSVFFQGFKFTVAAMAERRIDRIIMERQHKAGSDKE